MRDASPIRELRQMLRQRLSLLQERGETHNPDPGFVRNGELEVIVGSQRSAGGVGATDH
jgi:hypothetical protein